jgi:hypothetical protein
MIEVSARAIAKSRCAAAQGAAERVRRRPWDGNEMRSRSIIGCFANYFG